MRTSAFFLHVMVTSHGHTGHVKQQLTEKVLARPSEAANTQEALRLSLPLAAQLRESLEIEEEQWEFACKWLQPQSKVTKEMFEMMCPKFYVPLELALDMFAIANRAQDLDVQKSIAYTSLVQHLSELVKEDTRAQKLLDNTGLTVVMDLLRRYLASSQATEGMLRMILKLCETVSEEGVFTLLAQAIRTITSKNQSDMRPLVEKFCTKTLLAKCGSQDALLLKQALGLYPDLHWQFIQRWLEAHRKPSAEEFVQLTAGDVPLKHIPKLFAAAMPVENLKLPDTSLYQQMQQHLSVLLKEEAVRKQLLSDIPHAIMLQLLNKHHSSKTVTDAVFFMIAALKDAAKGDDAEEAGKLLCSIDVSAMSLETMKVYVARPDVPVEKKAAVSSAVVGLMIEMRATVAKLESENETLKSDHKKEWLKMEKKNMELEEMMLGMKVELELLTKSFEKRSVAYRR